MPKEGSYARDTLGKKGRHPTRQNKQTGTNKQLVDAVANTYTNNFTGQGKKEVQLSVAGIYTPDL